jgi:hypothetical protein
VTVPAEMVGHLRNGLHSVLGGGAQGISQLVDRPGREQHPEWYQEPREHFNRACALLDLIGWSDPAQPAAAQIDLREHRWALMAALDVVLLIADADMEEADAVDAERAKRGEQPKREATIKRVLATREFASAVKGLADTLETPEGASGNARATGLPTRLGP